MSEADVETRVVNGFHTIHHEVKRVEASFTEEVDEVKLLKRLFDREEEGSSGHRWSFFDEILLKCVGRSKKKESDMPLASVIACTLLAVCLSEHDDFLRFALDIFSSEYTDDCVDNCRMTLREYAELLKTVLPRDVADSTIDENVNAFSLYLSSHPLSLDQQNSDKELIHFPKSIAFQYHTKIHKQILWPLKMAEQQVKIKFLGANYWIDLHRQLVALDIDCSVFVASHSPHFTVFVDSLRVLVMDAQSTTKFSGSSRDLASLSEVSPHIDERNGIYTSRRGRPAASKNAAKGLRPHSPIQNILRESHISTESRRFPQTSTLTVSVGSHAVSDLHKNLLDATGLMLGLKILIIEDSATQRKIMNHKISNSPMAKRNSNDDTDSVGNLTLEQRNEEDIQTWKVVEACNGEEAIQMMIDTKSNFDVIFVDEDLCSSGGFMLGHEFVRILRGHGSVSQNTVIVGCTASAEQNAASFLEAGADAVWQKPLPTPDIIYDELCKYIVMRAKS